MDRALVTNNDDRVKLVAYADDLAVLIAGSDLGEIQGKARATLGALRDWATLRGLTFSASKSQAISLKGGLRPGFTVPFGTDEIVAVGSVRKAGLISEEEMTSQWDRILDVWQDRWDSSDKGRWTYSLLPDIRRRLDLPLEVDHYVCQFLTGHGDFNAKL
ncbi:hypothetical protein QTP88_030161 [Uroleucon formosanum]